MFCIGAQPAPPSPDKSLRNSKGEGRRPGSRHGKHKPKHSLATRDGVACHGDGGAGAAAAMGV